MAELAAAGSVVGLISLSIQSCQGLTSYYSAWRSYDEQISQTYRYVDELRLTCEHLERELQNISQIQKPAVEQVVELIASCQDEIHSLRYALDRCHSTHLPQSLGEKIVLHRARLLYPFKKQTLQTLKGTVHDIQGNLGSALQVLQLHLSAGHEQRLASLAKIISGTETAAQNNQTAIQALFSPLQAISQALPLIQQQTESIAITVRAAHDEAHDSRQDARGFRERMLQELTDLASCVDKSPRSLETTIAMTLNRHSAEVNQLKHDLQFAHSQHTGEVVAQLKTMDQKIRNLQIGLIDKPGLMQSVCQESSRLENLPASDNACRDGPLSPRDGRMNRHQRCSCKPKHNETNSQSFLKASRFELMSIPKWMFIFETQSMSHYRACPLFANSARTTMAKLRIGGCEALLARAIEASISITTGAGGLSVSIALRCAHVVPDNNPAFRLVDRGLWKESHYPRYGRQRPLKSIIQFEALLDVNIRKIERLFRAGKASPYDVSLDGNTLLHVASHHWFEWTLLQSLPMGPLFEIVVLFLKRLAELCVPLNWTNYWNLTFMNEFFLWLPDSIDPCIPLTMATRLLDAGAEFAKFSDTKWCTSKPPLRTGVTRYVSSAEFVDALENNELSVAILHQSEQELIEALQKCPHSINQGNRLAQTPLHWAVGWPHGVRELLEHGACVDSTDQDGFTPLYYAIYLGFSETVRLLMKADCSLDRGLGRFAQDDFVWHVSQWFGHGGHEVWGVSQESRMSVLDTAIALLAERHRDLQSRLPALPLAVNIDSTFFRDDRILDEYAELAEFAEEDALSVRGHDGVPLRASPVLRTCQSVYHIDSLAIGIAEKLWQNGFRDVDFRDNNGRTPLMRHRFMYAMNPDTLVAEVEICSWLVRKGAKLHRPQDSPLDYDRDQTLSPNEMPPGTRALHYVAYHIGHKARILTDLDCYGHEKQSLQDHLSRLSEAASLLPATIFSDVSYDDCLCACSSQGCLASTMLLKSFEEEGFFYEPVLDRLKPATECLVDFVGPHNPCWDWLSKEIIRFRTFIELELRHTCCRWDWGNLRKRLESEEQLEIRDEDHEKIDLLESLLLEFEENRGDQDLLSFLKGDWATRMDQVRQEQGGVSEEALREIGVTLYWDETDEGNSDSEMEESDSDD